MPVAMPYKLQIYLSEDTRQKLKEAAHRHETTLQDLVESWLEDRLEQEKKEPPHDRQRRERQAS